MILDSSTIVKLLVQEPFSDRAQKLVEDALSRGEELSVPDIALAEVLNALWKYHKLLNELSTEEFHEAVRDALRLWSVLKPYKTEELALEACEIALAEKLTIYDALYLALARRLGARLLSFDERMLTAARALGIEIVPIR